MSLSILPFQHETEPSHNISPAAVRLNTVLRAITNGEQAVSLLRSSVAHKDQPHITSDQNHDEQFKNYHLSDRLNFRTKYSNFIALKAAEQFIEPSVPMSEPERDYVAKSIPSILDEEPFRGDSVFAAIEEDLKNDQAKEVNTSAGSTSSDANDQNDTIERVRQVVSDQAISAKDIYGFIAQVTHDN